MDALGLHSTHVAHGATFGEQAGREVVLDFGEVAGEYAALRRTVGLVDLSFRDLLRITGPDRASFLQGMCTQEVANLPEGGSAYATILTAKGAMVADARVLNVGEAMWLDLEPGLGPKVKEHLLRYLISEEAELEEAREHAAVLGLFGPNAGPLVEKVAALCTPIDSLLGAGGKDLFVRRDQLAKLHQALLEHGATLGLREVGVSAWELLRVELGVPRYGQDLLETTIPLEANLDRAIHYKKGCYIGQEVIARATFRGQVSKKLVGLSLGEASAEPRDELWHEGKKVGFLTSVVRSPAKGEFVGLGYVHRDHLAPGTTLEVPARSVKATVVALPHVPAA